MSPWKNNKQYLHHIGFPKKKKKERLSWHFFKSSMSLVIQKGAMIRFGNHISSVSQTFLSVLGSFSF